MIAGKAAPGDAAPVFSGDSTAAGDREGLVSIPTARAPLQPAASLSPKPRPPPSPAWLCFLFSGIVVILILFVSALAISIGAPKRRADGQFFSALRTQVLLPYPAHSSSL